MRCKACKGKVIQRVGDTTRLRIEGPIEFDADGKATSHCWWCKAKVTLPLSLTAPAEEGERFTADLRKPSA